MITEHDLQEAIAECEGKRNPSTDTCVKLAAFYAIKDRLYPSKDQQEEPVISPRYSYAAEPIPQSEFRQAILGVDEEEFLSVMDELMSTVKTLMPRLYDGVMRKLSKN